VILLKRLMRYSILGLLYITLFTVGFAILENVESKKIANYEDVLVGFHSIYYGFFIFLIIYFPMTIITDFLSKKPLNMIFFWFAKTILFSLVGIIIGSFIFSITYPEWVEIDGNFLNRETSLIIFGSIGFIYSIITTIYRKK
jgi:hypothetical protein